MAVYDAWHTSREELVSEEYVCWNKAQVLHVLIILTLCAFFAQQSQAKGQLCALANQNVKKIEG